MKFIITIIILILITINLASSQLVINEIQPAPVGNEPEWIEIYNYSDSVFNAINLLISDDISSKILANFSIPAYGYGLITKDTLALKTVRNIPDNAVLIQASMPTYNNTTDAAVIRNSDSSVIDSIYYDLKWGSKGISFERVDWSLPATNNNNLMSSLSSDSATAGYKNSRAILNFDLSFLSLKYNSKDNTISALIYNNGKKQAENIDFDIYLIDNSYSQNILIYSQNISSIKSKDTSIFEFSILQTPLIDYKGKVGLLGIVNFKNDENILNDTIKANISLPYPITTIAINEFLFETDKSNGEFIELYNTSEDTINLFSWQLHDKWLSSGPNIFNINSDSFSILPKSYVVLTWDSAFFIQFPELLNNKYVYYNKSSISLNNTGDNIVLLDDNLIIQDSITYSSSWQLSTLPSTTNISLEKINPLVNSNLRTSWASCMAMKGATPCQRNSISDVSTINQNLTANPNPFSPFGTSGSSFCTITYNIPYNQAKIDAEVFDPNGALIIKLLYGVISGSEGAISWDGKNSDGYNVQVGPYILLLKATDMNSGKVTEDKIMIVIAK